MANTLTLKRVVVTGIGALTPVGNNITESWESLLAGKSGLGPITRFDATPLPTRVAAEVKDFDPTLYMDPKEAKRSDRYTQMGVAAAKKTMEDAGVDPKSLNAKRFGVILGSGIGGMDTIEKQSRVLFESGPRKISPFMIPSLIANIASGIVAIELGAKGPNFSVVSACSTGAHAIGEAFNLLRLGKADVILSGGAEAAISMLACSGFCSMRAMSTQYNDTPQKASRPFDKNRDGFVMGEGAALLLLETLEHAQARGAKIYAELVGYGASCDAYHITSPAPEGEGLADCMRAALEDAGLPPESVDYINAHGTSTPYNDKFETAAIKAVFGERAKQIPISSTKSMTGHMLGAAGSFEAAVCCKAIETGEVPPTINLEEADPECDLDYVPNVKRTVNPTVTLSNNLGFGGHNVTLIFKKLV